MHKTVETITLVHLDVKPKSLRAELASLKQELKELGASKPQYIIDDDEEYQEQLELGWYKRELIDRIDALERDLKQS